MGIPAAEAGTARNMNTVAKLAELAREHGMSKDRQSRTNSRTRVWKASSSAGATGSRGRPWLLIPTVMGVTDLEIGFGRQLVELGYKRFVADLFGKEFRARRATPCLAR